MNIAAPFIRRPVGTMLLTLGMVLAGVIAFLRLPVAPLPQIDFPTVNVTAVLPGASPQTMGSSVAAPLEKKFQAIAGLTEMTSRSNVGITQITLQFDLARDIDGAAREVQAAINAARGDLPATLKANPTYRKINPSEAPILILSLTSDTRSPAQIYDAVSTAVQQRLLQVPGVGDVQFAGASLPAVRVDLDVDALSRFGIPLEDVRTALQSSAANRPKGVLENDRTSWLLYTRSPGLKASDYGDLIVAWRSGAAVRLSDVARVHEGAEDIRTAGYFNGRRAVDILVSRQPGANIVSTIDAVNARMPGLRAAIPADVKLDVAADLSGTIRASLHEVEITLIIAVLLVIAVVGVFLQSWRATVVPAVATIASLLGTLAMMYLLGFSLNNLSLMALTIATGFVVDDAIVVLENIQRHIEDGIPVREAALRGAGEVAFTVLSISLSLVAVFIPLLFMGGLPGRLFNEFAVTMTIAVLISLVLSLTATPMLASLILRAETGKRRETRLDRLLAWVQTGYTRLLDRALAHRRMTMALLAGALVLQFALLAAIPKGLFPDQDTGSIMGAVRADQAMSFDALDRRLHTIAATIKADPGVANVVAFTGGQRAGGGFLFVTLKSGTRASAQDIVARLRAPLGKIAGTTTFLNPVQDLRAGGRVSNAAYQYTLTAPGEAQLASAASRLAAALKRHPETVVDVDNDLSASAAGVHVEIARDTAARLGVTANAIDQTLYDAFGQRQVSVIYSGVDQYHVVMGLPPAMAASPDALERIHVPKGDLAQARAQGGAIRDAAGGQAINTAPATMVPLSTLAHWSETATTSQTNHQDGASSATISFNLAPGVSLGQASRLVEAEMKAIAGPGVKGRFAGTASQFQSSIGSLPLLVALAILVIYIVLGMLYESWIHPLTVLSTLPSAALGAVAALLVLGMQFDLIAAIGVILLIGIVKKNAILIIDFALEAERTRGLCAAEAIREAALLRFRPILMTTLAAALGALPLAIGFGTGAELRQPLGVAIFGGLVVSQMVTLFTTPVLYVLLDRFRSRPSEAPSTPAQEPLPA
ncbi:efflux RND transporter permease subunit [Novosphingobium guangzhouense]|uniref:Nodulation protein n=1 Tax=Novosphingobium guangzhouense TaxID=1850347 RepID=A0A2K2G3H6_9SPHN|nr:efflux RND transporter permease subunit [Novosphingobium guangzhouense]PNU05587.1 nodulation protein [Novosphingobium guangzhouense]